MLEDTIRELQTTKIVIMLAFHFRNESLVEHKC